MHPNVRVAPQPGLGLGLQVTTGGVPEGALVAILLAPSIYAPERQQELRAQGLTSGQYAMSGSNECVLDALKAVGLCAVNETSTEPPNLTWVRVRIPTENPLNDSADEMMIAAFANRELTGGEFCSIFYGPDFGRDHYPCKGQSIRKDKTYLGQSEQEMVSQILHHLSGCNPEVRAYASYNAWSPTEETLCRESVVHSHESSINLTEVNSDQCTLSGAGQSVACLLYTSPSPRD